MTSTATTVSSQIEQASAPVGLLRQYEQVRGFTHTLASPLSAEDCAIQSMADVSPTRWHLAHTTWFFETFVLKPAGNYQAFDPSFEYLFNSYYNSIGEQYPRSQRGLISRPGLEQVLAYRRHVDERMSQLLAEEGRLTPDLLNIVQLGLQHEQQHQELILTDIKHVLSCSPLYPAYAQAEPRESAAIGNGQRADLQDLPWNTLDAGVYEIGHQGDAFCFDNERPRHRTFIEACEVAGRPVSCGEYLRFIEDGGYRRPEFWLSLGWQTVQQQGWQAPLYWVQRDGRWQ